MVLRDSWRWWIVQRAMTIFALLSWRSSQRWTVNWPECRENELAYMFWKKNKQDNGYLSFACLNFVRIVLVCIKSSWISQQYIPSMPASQLGCMYSGIDVTRSSLAFVFCTTTLSNNCIQYLWSHWHSLIWPVIILTGTSGGPQPCKQISKELLVSRNCIDLVNNKPIKHNNDLVEMIVSECHTSKYISTQPVWGKDQQTCTCLVPVQVLNDRPLSQCV